MPENYITHYFYSVYAPSPLLDGSGGSTPIPSLASTEWKGRYMQRYSNTEVSV